MPKTHYLRIPRRVGTIRIEPWRHISSVVLFGLSACFALGAIGTAAAAAGVGPWANLSVTITDERPSGESSAGPSESAALDPTPPPEIARVTPPPLPPVDPALIPPVQVGDPIRVVVTGVWINLPVVRAPLDSGPGPRYPWCRVAEWMPDKGTVNGTTGYLFIYSHARHWEFGRLLDRTPKQLIGETIAIDVQPKGSGPVQRRRYAIVEVRQHVKSWADLADIPAGSVVLQTSETARDDGPKLVIIGRYSSRGDSPLGVPTAKPQVCD